MTVTASGFLSLSLSYLRAMLGDCETWRAIVQKPDTDWDTLATLIAAETADQTAALARIVPGYAEDDEEHPDFVSKPRAIIRHLDEQDLERLNSTGFGLNGMLLVTFEITVPEIYRDSYQQAYTDFTNKVGGIMQELQALPQQAGYLHLTSIGLGPLGQADPTENKREVFFVSEWLVGFIGGP